MIDDAIWLNFMKHRPRKYLNILGAAFGILAAVLAIWLVPKFNKIQNHVAELDKEKIGGVWFVPDGKTEDNIIWLDSSHIEPLFELLSSETIEENPSKWQIVGRVGFTYINGRHASVEMFDTKTDVGAFKCGNTYFRYQGGVPAIIKNAR